MITVVENYMKFTRAPKKITINFMICNTELDASHGRTLRRGENFAIVKTSRWRNFAVANAWRSQILRTESQFRNYVCTIQSDGGWSHVKTGSRNLCFCPPSQQLR